MKNITEDVIQHIVRKACDLWEITPEELKNSNRRLNSEKRKAFTAYAKHITEKRSITPLIKFTGYGRRSMTAINAQLLHNKKMRECYDELANACRLRPLKPNLKEDEARIQKIINELKSQPRYMCPSCGFPHGIGYECPDFMKKLRKKAKKILEDEKH